MVRIFSKLTRLKEIFWFCPHAFAWYGTCWIPGYVLHESKEVLMTTMLTLTATTVLLSSLFLLHRIW